MRQTCCGVLRHQPGKGMRAKVERGRLPSAIRKYLEHFQEKCEAVFRQEMRKNKEIERFCDSAQTGNALAPRHAFRLHLYPCAVSF
ncbi:hypothetical protein E5S70_15465 [Ensifer adhaerens]|nr:hypothetical protein [Ensifer canadensis]